MLGAALCMLVLVSTFVAFGSWPGETSGKQVDQVLLNEVTAVKKPQAVAVGSEAVKVAQRAEARRKLDDATRRGKRRSGSGGLTNGNTVAQAPGGAGTTGPTTAAGSPLAQVPAAVGGAGNTTDKVKQQTQTVTQDVTDTTQGVTNQVQNTVDQTATQVNQVVDQVVGGVQDTTQTTTQQAQGTVDNTTTTVTNTVGGLLGH